MIKTQYRPLQLFLRNRTIKYQQKQLRNIIKNIAKNDMNTNGIVLNGYHLTEENMDHLTISLISNTQVSVIYLHNCNITARGADRLAYVLKKNSSIEHLWMNGNNIQSTGAEAIADALRENKTLKTLGLGDNNIGNAGGKCIYRALKYNEVLTCVYLERNLISGKILDKICYRFDRKKDDSWENDSTSTEGSSEDDSGAADVLPMTSSLMKRVLSSIQEETDEDVFERRVSKRCALCVETPMFAL